jgi:hypothetical protein
VGGLARQSVLSLKLSCLESFKKLAQIWKEVGWTDAENQASRPSGTNPTNHNSFQVIVSASIDHQRHIPSTPVCPIDSRELLLSSKDISHGRPRGSPALP